MDYSSIAFRQLLKLIDEGHKPGGLILPDNRIGGLPPFLSAAHKVIKRALKNNNYQPMQNQLGELLRTHVIIHNLNAKNIVNQICTYRNVNPVIADAQRIYHTFERDAKTPNRVHVFGENTNPMRDFVFNDRPVETYYQNFDLPTIDEISSTVEIATPEEIEAEKRARKEPFYDQLHQLIRFRRSADPMNQFILRTEMRLVAKLTEMRTNVKNEAQVAHRAKAKPEEPKGKLLQFRKKPGTPPDLK